MSFDYYRYYKEMFRVVSSLIKSGHFLTKSTTINSSLRCCLWNKSVNNNHQNDFKIKRIEPKRFISSSPINDVNNEANRIWTIPNCLTFGRIGSIPAISWLILNDYPLAGCSLFLASAITDFLDGYIARNWPNQKSYLGSILDPAADKLLIGTLTVTLMASGQLPMALGVIILTRDIGLILSSIYVRCQVVEKPLTFKKFFNVKQYSPVQIEADQISKFNTFLQLVLITVTLPSNLFDYNDILPLVILQYSTGLTTILSSISYISKRGSYKILKSNDKKS
jgi:cardiolipin synthase (CMP-forming)